MRFAVFLFVAFACSGAFASEPGQPLDCSDWVMDQPGLSCSTEIALPCSGPNGYLAVCAYGIPAQADNEGSLLYLNTIGTGGTYCGGNPEYLAIRRHELTRLRNGVEELIAHVQERCGQSPLAYADRLHLNGITFDAAAGKVRVAVHNFQGWNMSVGDDVGGQLLVFSGFATTFDILQTYTPQTAVCFRVPYMPEGMAAADHFDTY
jgi:hypothetical protein